MRILVLGATGLIGGAVLRALVAEGHRCTALLRHPGRVAALPPSVEPICGDIRHPAWLAALAPHDAVIHAAASFDDDMAAADLALTTALVDWGTRHAAPPHLILTGGCWLYPARHEPPLVEGDAFAPLPAFRWMLDHRARLEAAGCVRVTMVHPAIVWTEAAGQPAAMAATLTRGEAVTVVGDPATRWPLVHADDLAQLYVRAVAHGGPCGDLHGVTESGVAVGDIVATLARHFGLPPLVQTVTVADAVARHGDWIAGQARSQVMLAPRSRALRGGRRVSDDFGG